MHAKWLAQYYNHIRTNKDIVKNGWCRSGITKAIKKYIRKEDSFENQALLGMISKRQALVLL